MQPGSCAIGTEPVEAVRSGFAVPSTGEASQGELGGKATPPPHALCARYASKEAQSALRSLSQRGSDLDRQRPEGPFR